MTTREQFDAGEPGIYRDIPFPAYAACDAVNASLLKEFIKSPAHAADYRKRPESSSRQFAFGTGTHAWLLEPHRFSDYVVVATQCEAITGKGRRCSNAGTKLCDGEWFCGVRGHCPGDPDEVDRTIVTVEEFEQIQLAADQLCRHTAACRLLTTPGDNELTILARDPDTGLLLKARLDLYRPQFRTLIDIKTTKSAQYNLFAADIGKLGYDLQAGFYHWVARLAGLEVDHVGFIAIEKTRPYLPDAFRLSDNLVETAGAACRRLLIGVKACMESGEWPGYSDEFRDIDVAPWRYELLERC